MPTLAIAFFKFSLAEKEMLKFNHRKWCATRHINSWLGTENFDKIGRGEQIYQKMWRLFERKHPPRITEFYEWFLKYRYLNYNTPNHRLAIQSRGSHEIYYNSHKLFFRDGMSKKVQHLIVNVIRARKI